VVDKQLFMNVLKSPDSIRDLEFEKNKLNTFKHLIPNEYDE
jgi:hypothetical protein